MEIFRSRGDGHLECPIARYRLGGEDEAGVGEDRVARLLNPVWLRISGSDAVVANPGGAAQIAGTALSTCMAVATLAERTCSAMVAAICAAPPGFATTASLPLIRSYNGFNNPPRDGQ
jgi:hypothetical protein